MNILLLSRGIPNSHDAQYGGFEFDQAKALTESGHQVIIAAVDTRFRFYLRKPGLSIYDKDGIKVYSMFYCPTAISRLFGRRFSEWFTQWQWKKMSAIIQRDIPQIDIIYAHYLFISYYAVMCFANFHAPIIAMEHWSALNQKPIDLEVERKARYTYPRLTKILAVSEPLKKRIEETFEVTPMVVHNMVGNEFRYTDSIPYSPFTFISVGSLLPIKNHKLLISALASIPIPRNEWQLIIIGNGKEKNNLQAQINENGLQNNIHLLGAKSKQEIAELLNRSHVFALPSISENFSVAVLEALACGLPVVASICGGIKECIDEKNGLLFKVNNLEELSQCLKCMFDHYGEYNRKAIADNCIARFSSEVIAKQLTKIFEEVTK